MSNTFSSLIPILYSAQQIVARELTGAIAAVDQRFDDKGAALNETVRVPISPTRAVSTYTPAMTTSAGVDSTEGFADVVVSNTYQTSFNLQGEQIRFLELGGGGDLFRSWMEQSWAQCMRGLANQIELDLCSTIYKSASRAFGTQGTTPFGSNISAVAQVRKILDDNGAPMNDRNLVVNTAAGLNLRSLTQLTNFYQTNSTEVLTGGLFFNLFGIGVRESAQIVAVTKGTGTSYVFNGTAALNATTFTVKTGSGTILAGDLITCGSDTNIYTVLSSVGGSTVTSITIGAPGLLVARSDSDTITVGGNYTPNFALQRSSTVAVIRPPIIPPSPLIQQYPITDEKTGLTFLACQVIGDGMITYRLHAASGYKVVQQANVAILAG